MIGGEMWVCVAHGHTATCQLRRIHCVQRLWSKQNPPQPFSKVQLMNVSHVLMSTTAVLAALSLPAHAQTACAASGAVVKLSNAQITALVSGKTVCGLPGANYPGSPSDRFQEEHLANGDLFDFKLGPGHPVDPREKVGTWSVGQGLIAPQGIVHSYSSIAFSWSVFGPATNVPGTSVYSFCSGTAEHVRAHVIPTGSGCATFPSGASANAKLVPKVSNPRTPATVTTK